MIKVIVCMKDTKTGFLTPQEDINVDSAKRNFRFAIKQSKAHDTILFANPDDFELWKLGNFDTETGIVVPDLQFLCSARDFVEVKFDEVPHTV